MHKYRSAARNLAWTDENNPFAKRRLARRTNGDLESAGPSIPHRAYLFNSESIWRADGPHTIEEFIIPSTDPDAQLRPPLDEYGNEVGDTELRPSPPISVQELSVKSENKSGVSEHDQSGAGSYAASKVSDEEKSTPAFRKKNTSNIAAQNLTVRDDETPSKFTLSNQFFAILEGGTFVYAWKYTPWLSLLYLAIPIGFVVNYTHQSSTTIFAVNLVAILPSAALLSLAVEELGLRVGEVMCGLLNATFSNQLGLLRSALLGAILSNLLFMTGIGFLFGGIGRLEQYFHKTLAQTICCLLMLAVLSLIIPSAAHYLADMSEPDIIKQSRGISVVILLSYVLWLYFQLHTNKSEFDTVEQPPPKVDHARVETDKHLIRSILPEHVIPRPVETASGTSVETTSTMETGNTAEPKLSVPVAIGATIVSLVLLWFNTEFATNSVQGMLEHTGVSQTFAGITILPLLSNDWNMPLLARQNRMQMLLELTVEKSMQTALAIVPIVVLVGWGIGINLTLEFDGFVIAATFAAMVMVSYVVQEGKSNWLVGALLIKVYIILSIAAFFISD